eukprot:TRINITY_DN103189_c0_g1_i1.p1 TRINITY_DN103189_c0_g1~~TRINITY_DN103189_c0_g1_i1.p1  ORF type:complete len:645 (+),score=141.55 TRINITY_DN103189_c0_g1_i1:80-2014(+)
MAARQAEVQRSSPSFEGAIAGGDLRLSRLSVPSVDECAWRPLLSLPAHHVSSSHTLDALEAACSLSLVPVQREQAGEERLRVRDAWNLEELRLGDALARGGYTCAEGLDEHDFRYIVADCWGDELQEDDIRWTLRLAARGANDGRPVSLQELHYAMRAWHGLRSLPKQAMRHVALLDMRSHESQVQTKQRLKEVFEELNGGYPVSDVEVSLALSEALCLGGGGVSSAASASGDAATARVPPSPSRSEVLQVIGAWYANVQREDTAWMRLFQAWCGRWPGAQDYHLMVLDQLARFAPEAARDLELDEPEGSRSLEFPSAAMLPSMASRSRRSPMDRVFKVTFFVISAALLLSALVLPTLFLAWLVYVGSFHGNDACPRDLDGLLTWFGALGLAGLSSDCAEVGMRSSSRRALMQFSSLLRAVLSIFPWVGIFWSFGLRADEQVICGRYLWSTSALIWPLLLLLEVAAAFAFLWGFAVLVEHELSLRHVLAAAPPALHPARTPTAGKSSSRSAIPGHELSSVPEEAALGGGLGFGRNDSSDSAVRASGSPASASGRADDVTSSLAAAARGPPLVKTAESALPATSLEQPKAGVEARKGAAQPSKDQPDLSRPLANLEDVLMAEAKGLLEQGDSIVQNNADWEKPLF